MNKLFKLIENEKYEDHIAVCDDCDWEGAPSDCETYTDIDGFLPEGTEYTIAICPKCNGEEVHFIDTELL